MIKQTIQLFALPLGVQLAPPERDAFLKALPLRCKEKFSNTSTGRISKERC